MLFLKTLLVECIIPRHESRINEVSDIAKAANYNVIGQITQHRKTIDPAFYIGEGKLDEIRRFIEENSIEVVIFTQQLSAGQIFRIKKKLGDRIRVLDRNLLILEIFEKLGLELTLAQAVYLPLKILPKNRHPSEFGPEM